MRYVKETDIEKVTSEILSVLENNKVSIGILDKVLCNVRDMAYFNTIIQNPKERTAPEVPVQEQTKTLELINKEFDINLSQKQYDDIAIFDLCTQKYTAYEILKLLKMLNIL